MSAEDLLNLIHDLATNRGGCLDDWAYEDLERLDAAAAHLKQATVAALWDRLDGHVAALEVKEESPSWADADTSGCQIGGER